MHLRSIQVDTLRQFFRHHGWVANFINPASVTRWVLGEYHIEYNTKVQLLVVIDRGDFRKTCRAFYYLFENDPTLHHLPLILFYFEDLVSDYQSTGLQNELRLQCNPSHVEYYEYRAFADIQYELSRNPLVVNRPRDLRLTIRAVCTQDIEIEKTRINYRFEEIQQDIKVLDEKIIETSSKVTAFLMDKLLQLILVLFSWELLTTFYHFLYQEMIYFSFSMILWLFIGFLALDLARTKVIIGNQD